MSIPKRNQALTEAGTPGLNVQNGFILDDFIKNLQGEKARKTYLEMSSNDPTVGALLFAIQNLISQVKWVPVAQTDSAADQAAADFVVENMNDMEQTWSSFISEAVSFLTYGFSWHEIVYKIRDIKQSKYDDKKIGWKKIPSRPQSTIFQFVFDDDTGELEAAVQLDPKTFVKYDIPLSKSILFRTTTQKDNPEGRSILRNAYRPWFFKKKIEEIEAIGIERDLAGFPLMSVPIKILSSAASAAEQALAGQCLSLVQNIKRNNQEGAVIPQEFDDNGNPKYKLELLSSGGKRNFDTNKIIARKNNEILSTALADFVSLGHESNGSYALSSDKTKLFAMAIAAWVTKLAEEMDKNLIGPILALNNMPGVCYFKTSDIEKQDLDDLSNFITRLGKSGFLTPTPATEDELRKLAGLPLMTEETP